LVILIVLLTNETIPIKFNTIDNQTWDDSTKSKTETPQFSFGNAWTSNGTAICTANGVQNSPQIITDGAGGVIITWVDERNGNYDIYAQRVNSSGITQWTANGTAICTAVWDQNSPQIITDGAGGVIITWVDERNGLTNSDIYGQRVNSSGSPQWADNGTVICNAINNQWDPQITSDGVGGAIITWEDFRYEEFIPDIYVQWINSSGSTQWTSNGTVICNAIDNQKSPQIITDGAGGVIIAWDDQRSGSNRDIYAQMINSSGSTQWTSNGTAICTANGVQTDPQITRDGAGGAIITWLDTRSGNFDIYAQRVNSSGSTQWTSGDTAICTAIGSQADPQITRNGIGGAIITWQDQRSGAFDIYAQRVNSSGNTQWTSNGTAICTAGGSQIDSHITSDGGEGAIITWRDQRSGDDIYAQRVNSSGSTQWTTNGISISNVLNNQVFPQIISDGAGGAFITWQDQRSGNFDIYAQLIKNDIPTSNHPEPINTFIDGSETINWTLHDDCGGGEYRVVANNTVGNLYIWVNWTPWINNSPLNIPINFTELGAYNYIIEYYDDQYQYGIPDTVMVSIDPFEANISTIFFNGQNKTLQKYFELDYYENLNITIEYRETLTWNFIDGATVELTGGTIYALLQQHPIYEQYNATINAANLNLGINILTISAYKLNYTSVSVNITVNVLDIYPPNITVQLPLNNTYWSEPPLIKVSAFDVNLDKIWYNISGIPIKEFLQNDTAEYLNDNIWANIPQGPFEIHFYANDSAGNIGNQNISLNKHEGMWLLSPFIIDDLGGGDYTWLEAAIQGWCKGSGTSSDPYVIENIIIDGQNSGSCIEIRNSNEYVVINNSIVTNSGDGMTDAGIGLFTSNHVELLSNNCSNNNAYGIYLSSCQDILIEGSTINNNAKGGIMLYESDNNIIRNNIDTINSNTEYGIYLSASHYNEINGNAINYNSVGIYFYESNYNTITNNDLQYNNGGAMVQESCTGNGFSDNNPPIGGGGVQFPFEMLILIISIGAVAALGITGTVVLKKRRSVPKKVKKVKKLALISQVGDLKEYNVFLSYSTKDSEYFQLPKIVKNLKQYPEIGKVLYWEVDSGENIVEYMEETLKITNVFVLFCSENSLNSKAVKDEWQSAFQIRKERALKILPVFEDQQYIPRLLLQMLNVEYTKDDFKEFIQNLYEEILR